MENKQSIRKAFKSIEKLSETMEQGMYMDNAMDGSGECGGIIFNGWVNWFNRQLSRVLVDNQVTLDELKKTANEWANLELEMGPKQIFIAMYSSRRKKEGFRKEVDFLDTKWGNILMFLHNTKQYS